MALCTCEAGSTSFDPIPAGTYTAMIEDAEPRAVTTRSGQGVVLDITYLLQAPAVAAKLGRNRLPVRQGIFLDLTPDGRLDMSRGKNVALNRVRAALGQNNPGQLWNLRMLKGAGPLKVVVRLGPDKNSRDVIYNDVVDVIYKSVEDVIYNDVVTVEKM
jgi:hypothetical protein